MRRIAVLCGGVGAARLLAGLVQVVDPASVAAIVNVADDDEFHGLHVSPDIDTVLYTLGGVVEESQGWGRRDETFHAQAELARFGEETWFRVGDRDLAAHIHRTRLLRAGMSLTDVVDGMRRALGIRARILPATDAAQRTMVRTAEGWIAFQEYFVRRRTADAVREIRFEPEAAPTAAVRAAIAEADVIVIAPSNPFVSIGPILALAGMRDAIRSARAKVVAVSPIVGGAAIKGPAGAMLAALGHEVSALGVARVYADLAATFVLDEQDRALVRDVETLGVRAVATATIMRDDASRAALAQAALDAASR
ncbi:MAG TPA: 2-phospho-L-lactate transferase [Chloroflexi bacterium]|jgi:LPPG:FO 2-phospho-L-lactate transferase|nr:2-phospho-L-lactate transferase [Chloroflexota bacterium]HAL25794.1 2-phospho-L-lactate transferase [Chloroflexota bacterium]